MHDIERRETLSDKYSVYLMDPTQPDWSDQIDALRSQLGAPHNELLFPPHFIKKTLSSIGGAVMTISHESIPVGSVFLFPSVSPNETGYIARIHMKSSTKIPDHLLQMIQSAMKTDKPIWAYDPLIEKAGDESDTEIPNQGVFIRVSRDHDGYAIRTLQKDIWGAQDDFLYPADIHLPNFRLPTSLISYYNGIPAGFVFGFDKFSQESPPELLNGFVRNWHIRQESQLAGVLPEFRGRNIANDLKLRQKDLAFARGAEIINWTVDPLLSENAFLNLNKLGGIVYAHHINYYAFTGANKLNQVAASRFAISWLINSPRVKRAISEATHARSEIALRQIADGIIPIITNTRPYVIDTNSTPTRIIDKRYITDADTNAIAIEIPVNWNIIQSGDLKLAIEWRTLTDEIFQRYLGTGNGKYVLTDIVIMKNEGVANRAFLIGQSSKLLDAIYCEQDLFTKRF